MGLDYQFNAEGERGGDIKDDTQQADVQTRVGEYIIGYNNKGRERGRSWRKEGELYVGCVEFRYL